MRSEFTPKDLFTVRRNAKASNILVYGLGPVEYNRLSNNTIVEKIWDAIVTANEGTRKVRKFRIALLFTEYEAFKMNENDSLQKMITRLTYLVNELSSLGS